MQLPWRMMDFSAEHTTAVQTEQTVPFGKPVFQCSHIWCEWIANWMISTIQPNIGLRLASAVIQHILARCYRGHPRVVIRQVEESTGSPDRQSMSRVKTKEPNARPPLMPDVGSDIHLGKSRSKQTRNAA